jgi:hypothetical protein
LPPPSDVVQHFAGQFVVFACVLLQLLEPFQEQVHLPGRADHLQLFAPRHQVQLGEVLPDDPEILVVGTQDHHGVRSRDPEYVLAQRPAGIGR